MQSGAVQSAEAPAQVYQQLKRVFHVLSKRTVGIHMQFAYCIYESAYARDICCNTKVCGMRQAACGKQHAASSLVQQYKEIATSVQ
jgi:hypothetical protein